MRLPFRGSELKMGDGAGIEAFAKVAQVIGISDLGSSLETEDATDLDSNGWRERIATLLDMGEVTLDVHFDPAGATHGPATGLQKAQADRRLVNFQWTWGSAGTRWDFAAYVANVRASGEIAGKVTGTITLAASGEPNFAAT